jgi:hypothetical protein
MNGFGRAEIHFLNSDMTARPAEIPGILDDRFDFVKIEMAGAAGDGTHLFTVIRFMTHGLTPF